MRLACHLLICGCAIPLSACSALLDTGSLGEGAHGGVSAGGATTGAGAAGTGGTTSGGGSSGSSTSCTPIGTGKELCDGLDDDCDPGTPDVCPKNCAGFAWRGQGYMTCSRTVPWGAAEGVCMLEEMHLAQIDSADENAAVFAQVTVLGPWIWLGAQDADASQSLKWPDGTLLTQNGVPVKGVYQNFDAAQPEMKTIPNCLQISGGGDAPAATWSNTRCTDTEPFVCKSIP